MSSFCRTSVNSMARTFRLYPVEQHWWSFADYEGLLSITERFKPRRVLEFGPGSSTLALIEGGAEIVYSCEDDKKWLDTYTGRFVKHPVAFYLYTWSENLTVPALDDIRFRAPDFDMSFIDGPRVTTNRLAVLRYCIARSRVVVCPAEGPMESSYLAKHIPGIALQCGMDVEWVTTGPLTYAMAILTRKEEKAC